jgi:hypothetical protein
MSLNIGNMLGQYGIFKRGSQHLHSFGTSVDTIGKVW